MEHFSPAMEKTEVLDRVSQLLRDKGLTIAASDYSRPWGGFFVIDEGQTGRFVRTFFPHLSPADFAGFEKLSPKILVVAPGVRLSWQYHHRRAELWRVIGGRAGVVVSDTDSESGVRQLAPGDTVELKQGQRHRLIGLDAYGIVAEIWKHTAPGHPSDEEDIVRVQDDFGR